MALKVLEVRILSSVHQLYDFTLFKREINLIEYATSLGYTIDPRKSTRHSVVMGLDQVDKIIISRKSGVWVYFSVYDDEDNGTIIDFVCKRSSLSLSEAGYELQNFLGGTGRTRMQGGILCPVFSVRESKPEPKRIHRLFNKCTPTTDHSYLVGRGIGKELLRSRYFMGRVFQDRYGNAVFPHFKNGQVSGLEFKGEQTSLMARGSEKTLWRSNILPDDDTLVIAEAPIDAMSYHAIHRLQRAFYVATSGGFSMVQGELIKTLITDRPALKTIIVATDNDKGGNALAQRFYKVINGCDFDGSVVRHSPDEYGEDWNDVLHQMGI